MAVFRHAGLNGLNPRFHHKDDNWILRELSSIHSLNIFLSNGDKIFIPVSSGIVYKVLIEFSIQVRFINNIPLQCRKIN